ncbi:site-specific integrase [Microvirga aerophila]|uniref:Integrase n=1 Tax=Microvirga aerophila TaxID=670291 RepID=A0A512BZR0_9HYPH|nr:site-specific integrase [Microvirga aerophila]GEO17455.1 integrase [Microvirga aerophila]
MARMKYLQRRANRFEFRFPLPDDLAGKPVPAPLPETLVPLVNPRTGRFKTELIRSLQTNDGKVAERKVLSHIAETHALVDQARQLLQNGPPAGISPDEITVLVREHEIDLLHGDEALRTRGIGLDLARPGAPAHHDGLGMTDDDLAAYKYLITYLDKYVRAQAAKMRPGELIGFAVNRAVAKRGIVLHPDDPVWRQLELGFVKAQRSAFESINARLEGEEVPTPEPLAQAQGITITGALKRWTDGGSRGARKPRSRSAAEAEQAVRRFVELHGDLAITAITKAHGRAFRDALAKLPKALPMRLSRMLLPELLKQDLSQYPKRSAQTVNKILALLGGVLARAERDGFFEALPAWSNPFHVGFGIAQSEREPYEPFSLEELRRLFSSPVFANGERPLGGRGEAAFWFPLIALFSGARRTEIAQLRIGDVRQGEGGIWYFDFTNEGEDQSLKTASSARSVPVHAELIRLGLLDVLAASQANAASLWPGFEPPIDPKVKAWTKWFGRYLGAHVVDHPAKTFHSFRHTFKRACREAGLSEEIHHALTGHSGGGVGRRYGRERRADGSLDRGISLQRLQREINKIAYSDLSLPRPQSRPA